MKTFYSSYRRMDIYYSTKYIVKQFVNLFRTEFFLELLHSILNKIYCTYNDFGVMCFIEGQKKAQYEECEEKIKKNIQKIKILKREIKQIYQIKRLESTVYNIIFF